MGKKRVMIYMDEDLDKRWKLVSKKIKMSKSSMLESMLEGMLPTLEKDNANDMVSSMLNQLGDTFKDAGDLIQNKK